MKHDENGVSNEHLGDHLTGSLRPIIHANIALYINMPISFDFCFPLPKKSIVIYGWVEHRGTYNEATILCIFLVL